MTDIKQINTRDEKIKLRESGDSVLTENNMSIKINDFNKMGVSYLEDLRKSKLPNDLYVVLVDSGLYDGESKELELNDLENVNRNVTRTNLNDRASHKTCVLKLFKHLLENDKCLKVEPNYFKVHGLNFESILDIKNYIPSMELEGTELLERLTREYKHSVKFTLMDENEMILERIENYNKKFLPKYITPLYMQMCIKFDSFDENFLNQKNMFGLHVFETIKWCKVWNREELIEYFFWVVCSCCSFNIKLLKTNEYRKKPKLNDEYVSWSKILNIVTDKFLSNGIVIEKVHNRSELEEKMKNPMYKVKLEVNIFGYSDFESWGELILKKMELSDLEIEQKRVEKYKGEGLNEEENYQFWVGNAPLCNATEGDCSKIGPFVAIDEDEITSEDLKTYGSTCWSGKKVLCRFDLSKVKDGEYFQFSKLEHLGDPKKYRYRWYGSAPFCNPKTTDPLKDGYIPVASHSSGDGSNCTMGEKILAVQPRDVTDRYFKLLVGMESEIKKLEIDDQLTENAFKRAIFALSEEITKKI